MILSMFLLAAFYSVGFAVNTGSAARFFGTLALFLAAMVLTAADTMVATKKLV